MRLIQKKIYDTMSDVTKKVKTHILVMIWFVKKM